MNKTASTVLPTPYRLVTPFRPICRHKWSFKINAFTENLFMQTYLDVNWKCSEIQEQLQANSISTRFKDFPFFTSSSRLPSAPFFSDIASTLVQSAILPWGIRKVQSYLSFILHSMFLSWIIVKILAFRFIALVIVWIFPLDLLEQQNLFMHTRSSQCVVDANTFPFFDRNFSCYCVSKQWLFRR